MVCTKEQVHSLSSEVHFSKKLKVLLESSSSEVELEDEHLSEVFPALLMDVLIHLDIDSLGVTRSGDRMGMVVYDEWYR